MRNEVWTLLLGLGGILSQTRALDIPLSTDITEPVTVPYDPILRPNTSFIPLNIGRTASNGTFTQVHLALAGPHSVYIQWATGEAVVGPGNLTPNDPLAAQSVVRYGSSPSNLTRLARGTSEVYQQVYNSSIPLTGGATAQNYSSPILHTVQISQLLPNTSYYYQVGDGENFSSIYQFQSPFSAGPTYPQRLLLIADWGLSHNSSTTLDHIMESAQDSPSPPVILYIGDFCYADTWYPNGSVSVPNTAMEGFNNSGTWQPVWDAWQRFIEPLVSQVPMLGATGNHEIEQQHDSTIFAAVQSRWKVPSNASGSPSYFFYSADVGPSHNIILSPYVDYLPGSQQYEWLVGDLESMDRAVTPWVTVSFHNPWYTTDVSYKEWEQMRLALEPLTYEYGVDVFFYGHVHAYERTAPMYNWTIDLCGPVHITIGDGGNSEGLSFLDRTFTNPRFADLDGCPNVTEGAEGPFQMRPGYLSPINPSLDPWAYYERTLTFQADGNSTGEGNPAGYCYAEQPAWSLYRESSFGHGTLDIINATHAIWRWHRNQDANRVAVDQVYLVRNPRDCPNKAAGLGPSANGFTPLGTARLAPSSSLGFLSPGT